MRVRTISKTLPSKSVQELQKAYYTYKNEVNRLKPICDSQKEEIKILKDSINQLIAESNIRQRIENEFLNQLEAAVTKLDSPSPTKVSTSLSQAVTRSVATQCPNPIRVEFGIQYDISEIACQANVEMERLQLQQRAQLSSSVTQAGENSDTTQPYSVSVESSPNLEGLSQMEEIPLLHKPAGGSITRCGTTSS